MADYLFDTYQNLGKSPVRSLINPTIHCALAYHILALAIGNHPYWLELKFQGILQVSALALANIPTWQQIVLTEAQQLQKAYYDTVALRLLRDRQMCMKVPHVSGAQKHRHVRIVNVEHISARSLSA